MPFQFHRSFRIFPGVRVNVNRRSWSITLGPKHGPHYTRSSTGRTTESMPVGGGISWRHTSRSNRRR